jgi:DNA-binding response OmpR family regulator/two-component sensor histidine kinase
MKPIILIVDDEPAGRNVMESVLFNQGYVLEYAVNGREALKKAAVLKPDLILLDLMMPEMDGMQVCQQLRKDRELAEVPVVMITALDDRNMRIACLDAGADDFITKPFDRAELRARVRTITRLNRYRLLHERDMITSWIAEKASDGYLQVRTDDHILFANQRARFYLGLEADSNQPIPETFLEIVSRQYMLHPAPAWAGWPSSFADNAQNRFLVRPESETAHEFWLEAAIFEPPAMVEGLPRTRIIRLRDVTAEILNRRNTRSFGEAITHKIRTPVTHIVSSLDLLARMAPKMSADDISQFALTALRGAKRLQETLDRILKYSNISPVSAQGGFALSELSSLLERIAAEVGMTAPAVTIAGGARQAKLALSLQSLEVVLWEILGNSKKFHPKGTPSVTVDVLQPEGGRFLLRISDDGVSLSPRQLSIAMLPYYQGEKDFTGEAPGMGLGLSTVNAIVWGAGGSCRIMNRETGAGVTVELNIPEAQAEEREALSAKRLA